MNNYILVTKRIGKNYVIDSSSDDLKLISERQSELSLNKNVEINKIFTLDELASGRSYVSDKITQIAKSMRKYQYYPVFRIRFESNNPKFRIICHSITTGIDKNPKDDIKSMQKSALDLLNCTKSYEVLNDNSVFTNEDMVLSKCVFIGMDTWIPDPIGNYHSRCGNKSDEYIFNSFMDYIKLHTNRTSGPNEMDPQDTEMSYARYDKKRCSEFPVSDKFRNITDINQVRIMRNNEIVVITLKNEKMYGI